MRGVRTLGGVKHVKVLHAGAVMDSLPGGRHAGLVGAIDHDGRDRVNGIDEGTGIGKIHAVMIDQVEIDPADGIAGANERDFLGSSEIAKVKELELAKGDQDAGRAGVLAGVVRPLALRGAVWVGLGLDAGNLGDVLAVRHQNDYAKAGNLNGVARMNGAAGLSLDRLQIGRKIVASDVGIFAVWAVVEEFANGNAGNELGHAAYVVGMVVRDQQVIDARNAGVFHCRLDAIGVAATLVRPAGIHEHRLTGWGYEQSGLAAFDVNRIDEQVFCRPCLGQRGGTCSDDQQEESEELEKQRKRRAPLKRAGSSR